MYIFIGHHLVNLVIFVSGFSFPMTLMSWHSQPFNKNLSKCKKSSFKLSHSEASPLWKKKNFLPLRYACASQSKQSRPFSTDLGILLLNWILWPSFWSSVFGPSTFKCQNGVFVFLFCFPRFTHLARVTSKRPSTSSLSSLLLHSIKKVMLGQQD